MQAAWRLFVAVPMPEPVRKLVANLIDDLSAADLPIRWTNPDSAHLTLHFLGDTAQERAELLRLGLSAPVGHHQSFELRTGDLGVFPNPRQPRVVWLGLDGDVDRLERLARDVGRTLQQLGFPVEPGRYRPHITLGRIRDDSAPDLPATLDRALRSATSGLGIASVLVEEVLLVRGFLGKGSPRHDPIARYPLRKRDD
ncbi:MAG: RNA 2',3'-cyclic phosphodiesterase [Thermomicrobiales bacterium]